MRTILAATVLLAASALILGSCGRTGDRAAPSVTVAAAANLGGVFQNIARGFESSTGAKVILSFAATGDLARQIENAAPFDVFASADTAHVDALDAKGLLVAGTRRVYARGRLALWVPPGAPPGILQPSDLASSRVRFIAIANPGIAPYGRAAVETLRSLGLWEALKPKIVYAESIGMSRQYALSGNADASFTAYSLVLHEKGAVIAIDEKLHQPIDQALAVLKSSTQPDLARRFAGYVLGPAGRAELAGAGYGLP